MLKPRESLMQAELEGDDDGGSQASDADSDLVHPRMLPAHASHTFAASS
jgi:hypothetical protein